MDMPVPSAGHLRLEELAGTWAGEKWKVLFEAV